MNKVCGVLMCLLLVGCASQGGGKMEGSTRLRFVPGSAPSSPLEASDGAVSQALAPSTLPGSDPLELQALVSAGVGDTFPVRIEKDLTLFEVLLKDGDDERVSLEILSKEGSKTIEIQRDKSAEVEVAGVKYKIYYPSIDIASSEKKTTTNKATLIVSTRRK